MSPEAASGSGRPPPMTHRCADELSSHRFPPAPSGGGVRGGAQQPCRPALLHTQQLNPLPSPPFLSLTAGLGLKLEPWHRAMRRADSSHSLTALEA